MNKLEQIIAGKSNQVEEVGDTGYFRKEIEDHLVCADGMTLSVQCSKYAYCAPRTDSGPYTSVEVGYPGIDPPESWAEYADGDYPTDVYGWVPVELVRDFIAAHGGLISAESELGKESLELAGERMSAKMEEARKNISDLAAQLKERA